MSTGAATVARSMRIIAIPLTRKPKRELHAPALTYYHFITEGSAQENQPKASWARWATSKAAGMWADMGNAPQRSWKVCVSSNHSL